MKLAAIIVVYNPEPVELKKNILSCLDAVDHLLVYLNSPVPAGLHSFFSHTQELGKFSLLGNQENVGIAAALNAGAYWAMEHQYTHLLTLDQDSYFAPGHLAAYREKVARDTRTNIGVYGCNPDNRGTLLYNTEEESLEVPDVITSGSIYPVEVFRQCGVFEAELFIDAVDYEYCYRVRRQRDLRTLVFPSVHLIHQVGYPYKTPLGFLTDNYSPQRTYFIIRNHLVMWKRYPDLFQQAYKKVLIKTHIVYRVPKIILGEKQKFKKLKAVTLGICHGLAGRLGFIKM
jgi:rhamnosyltransferase